MPRYFFHRADGSVDRDTEGTELANLSEARKEAVVFAGGSAKDRPDLVWDGGEFIVEVEDERGMVLFEVRVMARTPGDGHLR